METVLQVIAVIGVFALGLAFLFTVLEWITRDATRRGKSPFLVFIAVVFFFPWGLIAWLLFRPDPIDPPGGNLNLRDFRSQ